MSLELLARLDQEGELAGSAALASNQAKHYDVHASQLMRAGELEVLLGLLGLVGDARVVRHAEPPRLPIEGGYGKAAGPITVGDKARFLVARLLPAALASEALARGPAWLQAHRGRLHWDPEARQFTLRERR